MKLDDSRSTVTSVNLTVQDRQLMVDHVFSINVSLAQEEKKHSKLSKHVGLAQDQPVLFLFSDCFSFRLNMIKEERAG